MPLLCLLKVPSGARALSVDRAWERGVGRGHDPRGG